MERRLLLPALATLFTLMGAARIVSTYPVFSQAWDEAAHIACGLEWWAAGTTTCDPANPPLARIAAAAALYWKGLRPPAGENEIIRGNMILHGDGHYQQNLAMARTATLIFYFLGALVVYRLGTSLFGGPAAVVAAGFYATLPMVLHVASLAYTDMALTACLALFVYRALLWRSQRSIANSIWLGVAAGASIGAKYSAIPYILVTGIALLAYTSRAKLARDFATASSAALLTLWAIFHFAITPISALSGYHPELDRLARPGTALSAVLYKAVETPLPLANLGPGLAAIVQFNRDFTTEGEPYYFLGRVRTSGIWYYFPMVLLCLFPTAFLLTALGGIATASPWTPDRRILVGAPLSILLVNMISNLTFAPRHIAAACPFLCILAGAFLVKLWNGTRSPWLARSAAVALLAAYLVPTTAAHPDYHAYSNMVQTLLPPVSLFDMGKDVGRLARELNARAVPRLSIAMEGSNDLSKMNLPPFDLLVPHRFTTGWIAISENRLKTRDGFAWLEKYRPAARIGTSIRLYYIDQEAQP